MEDKVILCLENIGCFYTDSREMSLCEMISDSIMFISFIVELEREFEIQIPDELLLISNFKTLSDVCLVISEISLSKGYE